MDFPPAVPFTDQLLDDFDYSFGEQENFFDALGTMEEELPLLRGDVMFSNADGPPSDNDDECKMMLKFDSPIDENTVFVNPVNLQRVPNPMVAAMTNNKTSDIDSGYSLAMPPENLKGERSDDEDDSREVARPAGSHWTLDHDYAIRLPGSFISEPVVSEPMVDVWKIESFQAFKHDEQPQRVPVYRQQQRRTSTRTAEMKRKKASDELRFAVSAAFETKKAPSKRPYKNIKPKNSVETTPSQSDIEEWWSPPIRYNVPVRNTQTAKVSNKRTTKKKTSKGRIDHSESERLRREVMRGHFSALSSRIPMQYLTGEKPSSQISKQKILNGAKAFIIKLQVTEKSYKSMMESSSLIKDQVKKMLHAAKFKLPKLRT